MFGCEAVWGSVCVDMYGDVWVYMYDQVLGYLGMEYTESGGRYFGSEVGWRLVCLGVSVDL